MANLQTILSKARANILLDHGFFGHMLTKHQIHISDRVPTLAVDNRQNIYVNPDFAMKFEHDNKKLQWALCHEIMHPVLNHLTRRGARHPKLWNYAGDAVINDLLNTTGVGTRIEGCVNIPGSSEKTTEQIYRELENKYGAPPPPEEGEVEGQGKGQGKDFDNGLGDDIIEGEEMSEGERALAETQTRILVADAAASAKVRGHLSGALAAFVNRILESEIPWFDKLHEYMQGLQRNDYSWARPNRRYIAQGHYLPSTGSTPIMGEIVVQIDVSGSVSQAEAAHFAGHIQRIVSECKPSKIHVIYTDVTVVRHDTFETADEVEFNFVSGGGTDMAAGFEYIDDQGIEPDVFITLTDGGTPWGRQQSYPVIWCSSDATAKPTHGILIPFEVKE